MLSAALPITRQLLSAPSALCHAHHRGSPNPFRALFFCRGNPQTQLVRVQDPSGSQHGSSRVLPPRAQPEPAALQAAPPGALKPLWASHPSWRGSTRNPKPRHGFTLPDGHPKPPCSWVMASTGRIPAAGCGGGGGGGVRAASREPALQSRGRRVQSARPPPAAAPRRTAPRSAAPGPAENSN
jgi:hypothetical protein